MGLTFTKQFSRHFAKKEMRILMVGLDAAGKTTILYKLKLGEIGATIQTIDLSYTEQFIQAVGTYEDKIFQKIARLHQADSGKLGDSDCSPILRSLEMELDHEERLGQVPDASWAVPEIPSPPTASGLSWPMNVDHYMETTTAFVPDVCYSSWPNLYPTELNGSSLKRRRQYY